jgi:hypothetical protein
VVTPGILLAVAAPAAAASPTTPIKTASGGNWSGDSQQMVINAYIDISNCPGAQGTVLSTTETWANGESTTQPGSSSTVIVPSPGNANQLTLSTQPRAAPTSPSKGAFVSLTAVILWTAGCMIGQQQTLTWIARRTNPTSSGRPLGTFN